MDFNGGFLGTVVKWMDLTVVLKEPPLNP